MTFTEQYIQDLAATESAIRAGIPAIVLPRPMSPNAIGSYNLGPCKALREARTARGLHPLTGSRQE